MKKPPEVITLPQTARAAAYPCKAGTARCNSPIWIISYPVRAVNIFDVFRMLHIFMQLFAFSLHE